jgi:uncharacterized protein YgiB involved in biofilm formation
MVPKGYTVHLCDADFFQGNCTKAYGSDNGTRMVCQYWKPGDQGYMTMKSFFLRKDPVAKEELFVE